MQKSDAVAAMGPSTLLLPAWIKAALAANDRLKLYLTILQAAAAHADHPDTEALDLHRETAAAGVEGQWLLDLPAACTKVDDTLLIPDLGRIAQRLSDDLAVMARPLIEGRRADEEPGPRVQRWRDWLASIGKGNTDGEKLTREQLRQLTDGKRRETHSALRPAVRAGHLADHDAQRASHPGRPDVGADSLHLLVMDLHKQIDRLASSLSTEEIAGAHVWQLRPTDRPHIEAFMRGLNRTAPLKFNHPGLDTAATRDGARLLLQNDIGTNDAHVLVMQVEAKSITLNYADLHRPRFAFFQALLAPFGAVWAAPQSKVDAALNAGKAYTFGTARFECADDASLDRALEGIGSRLVFLIDWNRARKRLLPFVGKADAIGVLHEVAQCDAGHMAWLVAGGEQLIFAAMQAAGEGGFRIGDRLDAVLGAAPARAFLVEVLCMSSKAMLAGQPVALVADETRLLLGRRMRQRSSGFDLVDEHAAYCHALAQAVSDGLAHDLTATEGTGNGQGSLAASHDIIPGSAASGVQHLAERAKVWERQADHLVMRARDDARGQPRWQPFARLLERSDDVADALEEAMFLLSLIAQDHRKGWTAAVGEILARLAQAVLSATQEHIKALAVARHLGSASDPADSDAFLAASWHVLRAERECDELLRSARRTILASISDAASLMLANDLAVALELASDRLLEAGYMLRELAFDQAEVRS